MAGIMEELLAAIDRVKNPLLKTLKDSIQNPVEHGQKQAANALEGLKNMKPEEAVNLLSGAGIFIGPKSALWDMNAAQAASYLLSPQAQASAKAMNPMKIQKYTNTTRGLDGNLRQEISDSDMKIVTGKDGYLKVLHPELDKAYPGLLDSLTQRIKIDPSLIPDEVGGVFSPGNALIEVTARDIAEAKSIAAHELQHAVSTKEGFSSGGSSDMLAKKDTNPFLQVLEDKLRYMQDTWHDSMVNTPEGREKLLDMIETAKILDDYGVRDGTLGYARYWKLKGEAEARITENRQAMDRDMRLNHYPWTSKNAGAPLNDLIELKDVLP